MKFINTNLHAATLLRESNLVAFSTRMTSRNNYKYGKTEMFMIEIKEGQSTMGAKDSPVLFRCSKDLPFLRDGFDAESARVEVLKSYVSNL